MTSKSPPSTKEFVAGTGAAALSVLRHSASVFVHVSQSNEISRTQSEGTNRAWMRAVG